jgi:hypothetical protein
VSALQPMDTPPTFASKQAVGIADLRYLHLGPDPLAKRLYSLAVAASRAAEETAAVLVEYLAAREPSWMGSGTSRLSEVSDVKPSVRQ